ncbi:probable ATP-dependent RNA helicase spindle-E [Scaptodrosophila lebanonensis]|uniref:Probable ATP-dependent RNA helicase spindle-E n=1 Tax=Drosophila lebanonensis TaxID=7225 RepID=A0A6J2TIZ9_DROLE|nr:probable ATP-dependent RNA helicase spindle-E [Scaptodrosophila lebanonensis]
MDNDPLMDFFDFSKDFKRAVRPSGIISGNPKALATETYDAKLPVREVVGTEYVAPIVAKEQELLNNLDEQKFQERYQDISLNEMEDDIDDDEMLPTIRNDAEYYKKFHFDLKRDTSLPIYAQREEIMEAIDKNPIVIIKGETGCGKTTQVPQYILDEAVKREQYCNIVVTQPRRIAAISIANRVSEERKWSPNTVCSYQVALHKPKNLEDTRLLYCTTGVLLNILVKQKSLTRYTHIVLDEVHERDQDMDFLLIVVRHLLALNSHHVKIVLMSATIDPREFAEYFRTKTRIPPVITASHGRKFPLVKFYREQFAVIESSKAEDSTIPGINQESYAAAIKILLVIDNMERKAEDMAKVPYMDSLRTGSVLIFLPGLFEIDTMTENINSVVQANPSLKIVVVRCHSLMTPTTQEEVFRPAPPGHRKVILSTNIAESSITVPDVSYVIDFCLTKVLITDTATNFSKLELVWASRANCRQRAGRVGRIRSGRVYRMVTRHFFNNCMTEFGIPEMLRAPLQTSVLKAKALDFMKPVELLALAMSPPNLSDIGNTILQLKEVGGLYTTVDGVYDPLDGDLTHWGHIMSYLPMDVRLSRLIILGYMFNILDEAIIITAGLTVRTIYLHPETKNSFLTRWVQYTMADGSGSDLVAIWRVFRTYINICRNHTGSADRWARRYRFNLRSLREMSLMVDDLKQRCKTLNLSALESSWSDQEKAIILKIIIAGAFYPNYFMCKNKTNLSQEREVYHIVGGNDPCRTVYFTNFEPRYMGELYTEKIKEIFKQTNIPPENIDVTFQHGSEKVFITFKCKDSSNDGNTTETIKKQGRVVTEVYKALRLRMICLHHPIRVMDQFSAMRYVEQNKIGEVIEGRWIPPSKPISVDLLTLPSLYDKVVKGLITHIESCEKFFFQPQSLRECIANMSEIFNSREQLMCIVREAKVINKGQLLLAWHRLTRSYQRAEVLKVESEIGYVPQFRVHFIDYGNVAKLSLEDLRLMSANVLREYKNLPPRMFECRLALVQPSSVASYNYNWAKEANDMLHSLAKHGTVELEIYSLVDNVAAVIIPMREGTLNDKLVEHHWARRADEDFLSRQDHDFRLRRQERARNIPLNERHNINEEYLRSIQNVVSEELEPPPLNKCVNTVRLKGPFSSLETSVHALMRVGTWKTVDISRESVNSVLLDIDPQDQHEQMMVAASVATASRVDHLQARNTTLMPNMHGFGALMTMLFCPTMQLKCNMDRTKYVCLLAGLGYNRKTMEPYYSEHDISMNLDVNIDKADITLINQIRYNIDTMFYKYSNDTDPLPSKSNCNLIFKEIRALIVQLLSKDRSYIESYTTHNSFTWENLPDLQVVQSPYGKRCIFPMHGVQELQRVSEATLLSLQENCESLYSWRNFEGTLQPMECKLCNYEIESVTELRLHLLTQLHRDREQQIACKKY